MPRNTVRDGWQRYRATPGGQMAWVPRNTGRDGWHGCGTTPDRTDGMGAAQHRAGRMARMSRNT
eukprot:147012-Chlamydomonas_euryale.AAC.1